MALAWLAALCPALALADRHLAGASGGFCDRSQALTARQQDRLLRVADLLRQQLNLDAGGGVALIARSGLDLRRFGLRYSHAGVALRDGLGSPWGVRQLYYACDEGRPRLFDQGLAGFVGGIDDLSEGYLSVLLLPQGAPAQALVQAATDENQARAVLGPAYSANAYAYSTRYQNCNQWLVELLALAWAPPATGTRPDAPAAAQSPAWQSARPGQARAAAQHWLGANGYAPAPVPVGSHWLMAVAGWVPLLRLDDHPEADRQALALRTSLPASIEAWVRQRLPGARRLELCHTPQHLVLRADGPPMADGCQPEPGDQVWRLDE